MANENTLTLSLEPTPRAPGMARQALRDWLRIVDCSDQTKQDVVLVVSELVTNAVVHAQSPPEVVATFDEGRLRLEVHDRDRNPPAVRSEGGYIGGYGLRLVDRLTDGWGWEPTPAGKRIWVETLY